MVFYVAEEAGIETASKAAGHNDVKTTKTYKETIKDGNVAAVSIMSAIKEG